MIIYLFQSPITSVNITFSYSQKITILNMLCLRLAILSFPKQDLYTKGLAAELSKNLCKCSRLHHITQIAVRIFHIVRAEQIVITMIVAFIQPYVSEMTS